MKIARLAALEPTTDPSTPLSSEDGDSDHARLLAYLRAGRVVQAARSLSEDVLDDQHRRRVPLVQLTDGEWIWSGAIIYYADAYRIPVDPDLVRHVTEQDFTMPDVDDRAVTEALTQLNQR